MKILVLGLILFIFYTELNDTSKDCQDAGCKSESSYGWQSGRGI